MKFWRRGLSVAVITLLTGGISVWAQQPGTGTSVPKAPTAAPSPAAAPNESATATPAATKVNINTADEATLVSVKGIGKSRAKAIVAYREKNGPFKTVDDLTKVKGIKEKSLNKFKGQLAVE
jgi:competence protein ComEA